MLDAARLPQEEGRSTRRGCGGTTCPTGLAAGAIGDHFQGNWRGTYLVPAILLAACCVVFVIGFRPRQGEGHTHQAT